MPPPVQQANSSLLIECAHVSQVYAYVKDYHVMHTSVTCLFNVGFFSFLEKNEEPLSGHHSFRDCYAM